MTYYFISFASLHGGRNLGCCVIQTEVNSPEEMNTVLDEKGLLPEECHSLQAFGMDEECFQQQGMELDRLYSSQEMKEMGF